MTLGFMVALIGSKWFRYAVGILAIACGYEVWKFHEQHIGRDKAVAQIEQKADHDKELADIVRRDVANGARGVRGKYQRDD